MTVERSLHLLKTAPGSTPAADALAAPVVGLALSEVASLAGKSLPLKPRQPAVRYLGFEITAEGREYSLQVTNGLEPRTFVLLVTHEAFASRQARYQDAPDLCYRKMGRELGLDPDLLPGAPLQLTSEELLDYRSARDYVAPGRKRRGSGA
jgi:hypothetical protein